MPDCRSRRKNRTNEISEISRIAQVWQKRFSIVCSRVSARRSFEPGNELSWVCSAPNQRASRLNSTCVSTDHRRQVDRAEDVDRVFVFREEYGVLCNPTCPGSPRSGYRRDIIANSETALIGSHSIGLVLGKFHGERFEESRTRLYFPNTRDMR